MNEGLVDILIRRFEQANLSPLQGRCALVWCQTGDYAAVSQELLISPRQARCAVEQAARKVQATYSRMMDDTCWQPGWVMRQCYRNTRRAGLAGGPTDEDPTYFKAWPLRAERPLPGGVRLELTAEQRLYEFGQRVLAAI